MGLRLPDMDFLFETSRLIEVAAAAVIVYVAVVILLRISGKRTLTDLNAFDFVTTVAIGSAMASTILSPSVTVLDGLVALTVLVACQAVVAFAGSRFDVARRAIKAEPTLVVHRGDLLRDAMRQARLSEAAVLAAVRGAGHADLHDVHAVVLETNGSLSVIDKAPKEAGAALEAARTPGV